METNNNSEQSLISYSETIMRLLRTTRKELSEYSFEKSKQFGCTGPQLFLIFILYRNPGINLQELSERLGLSKSTVSGIVDRLVSQGDVTREIPSENRRSVRLFLSPNFLEKCDLMAIKRQFLTDLVKDASEQDLKTIIEGLEKLHEMVMKNKIK
ncbi:MAG: MarR family winged helix-turn-helix transcriptional regulator [Aminipila sp.]